MKKAMPVIEWLLSGLDTLLSTFGSGDGSSPLFQVGADIVAVVKQIVADWKDGKLNRAEFDKEKNAIFILLNDATKLNVPAPGPEILKLIRDCAIPILNVIENHIPV